MKSRTGMANSQWHAALQASATGEFPNPVELSLTVTLTVKPCSAATLQCSGCLIQLRSGACQAGSRGHAYALHRGLLLFEEQCERSRVCERLALVDLLRSPRPENQQSLDLLSG